MTWNRLQSASATTPSNITTLGVTYTTANLTAGTVLLAAVSFWNANAAGVISTVKDGAGNSFTQVSNPNLGSPTVRGSVSLWALPTPAGDVGSKPTITATWTGGTGATGASILVQEVAGILATPDGTPGTASATGASSITPSAYSSAAPGEYLVAVFGDDGGPETATQAGSGYTTDANSVNNSANSDVVVAYKSSTGGAESGGWTMSGTLVAQGAILVAFPLVPVPRYVLASQAVKRPAYY